MEDLVGKHPNHPYYGTKVQTGTAADGKPVWGYEWMTTSEVMNAAQDFGKGLM